MCKARVECVLSLLSLLSLLNVELLVSVVVSVTGGVC